MMSKYVDHNCGEFKRKEKPSSWPGSKAISMATHSL